MRVRLSNFFSKCAVVSAGVIATVGVANAQLGGGSDLLRQSPQTKQFVENLGQWDSRALFVSGQPGMDYWVTRKGIKVDLYKFERSESSGGGFGGKSDAGLRGLTKRGHVVAYELAGAGASAEPWGYEASDFTLDFFVGPTSRHARGVRAYGEAYIKSVLPGVHMRNYLEDGRPRYDVIVEPGADPTQVVFNISGADRVYVDAKGDLVVETDLGLLTHSGLYAYQPIGNMQMNVDAEFVMLDSTTVMIRLGDYDSRLPIIIDPLVYGTYVGSDSIPFVSTGWETLQSVVADEAGNLFLGGSTTSLSFPVTNGVYGNFSLSGAQDAFLMRLAGDAYHMSYAAYLGGSDVDSGLGIGLDTDTGSLWIGGTTASNDFPGVVNGSSLTNLTDIFLSKFTVDNAGNVTPNFSTYYDGAGPAMGWSDMEVSQTGVVYLAGTADNADIGAFTLFLTDAGGGVDGWVTKFAADGNVNNEILVGGVQDDTLTGIAVDSNDNVVIAGSFGFVGSEDTGTASPPSFPTTSSVFENGRFIRNGDAYVVKINSVGTTVFSALLGGASGDIADSIAVDQFGDIFVLGRTNSFDFPRNHGAFDENFTNATKSYTTKIEDDGTEILYSTGLQTLGNIIPTKIAVDDRGIAVIGGIASFVHPGAPDPTNTIPGSIPLVNELDGVYDCGDENVFFPNTASSNTTWPSSTDGFVMFLNAAGSGLLFSDYLGECGNEVVNDVIVDPVGATWIAGDTAIVYTPFGAPHTPTGMGVYITSNADKSSPSSAQDGFAVKLRVDLPILNSVAFDPQQIAGGLGALSTATITLRDPAPPGGVTLQASLSNAGATSFSATPGDTSTSFTIDAGLTSTTVEVFSLAVTTQQTSDIRVTLDNDFMEDRLTIKPWLDDFSASLSTLVGGNQLTVRTTLFDIAPEAIVVSLSTNRPELLSLPAQMTIPAGASTAAILVDTEGVVTDQDLTLTATLLGVAKDADVTLIPATVQTLSFDPSTVNGGASSTGTVTLNGAAGADRTITISYVAGEAGVTVDGNALPHDIMILAGATGATFSMETPFAAAPTFATVDASDGTSSASGTLFIEDIDIEELVINPATDVISGSILTGSVKLTRSAGAGGFTVDLGNSNTAAGELSDTTVTIPEGSKVSPTFNFTAAVVSSDEVTTLSASKTGFTTRDVVVTVRAIDIDISLDPTTVVGGVENSVATITLTAPAPVGGLVVALASSDDSVASVPATATIPAGDTTVDFDVTSLVTPTDRIVNISVTASPAVSDSTNLLVLTPGIVSIVIDPSAVTGPGTAQATVTISTAAPEDGLDVAISASPASVVSLPSVVNVPEGSTSVTFDITTSPVNFDTDVTVTATIGSAVDSAVLTVRSPSVAGITFSPPLVQGGGIAIGTITLNQPAPAGGITVDLTSFNTTLAAIIGSSTILIPEGSRTGTFSVQTVRVSRLRSVMFQGGPSGTTQFATGLLYIKP